MGDVAQRGEAGADVVDRSLQGVVADLELRGASVAIAGCTEGLALRGEVLALPVVDPVEALAEAVIGRVRGGRLRSMPAGGWFPGPGGSAP